MTTTAERRAAPSGASVSLPRVARSEWTKLWSLRSTWWLVVITAVLGVGLAALIGSATDQPAGADGSGGPPPALFADSTALVLFGTAFGSLVLGVLGALTMSAEYSSGTITASLTAVPRRWPLLLAKAVVLVVAVAPVSFVITLVSLVVGSALLPAGRAVSLSDPGVWGALVGTTGYLTAVALLGLGLATLLRSSAGSITVLVALVFVLPAVLPIIPWEWVGTVSDHLPSSAGDALRRTVEDGTTLGPLASALTLLGWSLVPLLLGALALRGRDA